MRATPLLCVLLILSAIGHPIAGVGQSSADSASLEQQCSANTAEWFKELWPKPEGADSTRDWSASYLSHYNQKLAKCFMVLTVKESSGSRDGILHALSRGVYEVKQPQALAKLLTSPGSHGLICTIQDHVCKSATQWDTLVRAYYLEDPAALADVAKQ